MPDEDPTQAGAEPGSEPVSDYRRPPNGVIPKNATTWVIVGVSVFIIIVLIFISPDGRRSDDEPEPESQVETRPLSEEEELNRGLAEQLRRQEEGMRAIARSAALGSDGANAAL